MENVNTVKFENNQFVNCSVNYNETMKVEQKNEFYDISKGGAVYLEQNNKKIIKSTVDVKGNTFKNGIGSSGGAMFIIEKLVETKLAFEENKFENCTSDIGSGIRVLGSKLEIDLEKS